MYHFLFQLLSTLKWIRCLNWNISFKTLATQHDLHIYIYCIFLFDEPSNFVLSIEQNIKLTQKHPYIGESIDEV